MTDYRAEDWPHGLICADCERPFVEGQPISEVLHAFQDDVPVLVIKCGGCAVGSSGEPK